MFDPSWLFIAWGICGGVAALMGWWSLCNPQYRLRTSLGRRSHSTSQINGPVIIGRKNRAQVQIKVGLWLILVSFWSMILPHYAFWIEMTLFMFVICMAVSVVFLPVARKLTRKFEG